MLLKIINEKFVDGLKDQITHKYVEIFKNPTQKEFISINSYKGKYNNFRAIITKSDVFAWDTETLHSDILNHSKKVEDGVHAVITGKYSKDCVILIDLSIKNNKSFEEIVYNNGYLKSHFKNLEVVDY